MFAQSLTLSELLSLRKKEIAEVDEYLTKRKWSLLEAEEPSEENLGSLLYSSNRNSYDDKAKSFIRYFYSNDLNTKVFSIQFQSSSVLNKYVNQIKTWGGKLQKSYVEDGAIVKIYRGSTMTYKVVTDTQSNDFGSTITFFVLYIYTNEDFDLIY